MTRKCNATDHFAIVFVFAYSAPFATRNAFPELTKGAFVWATQNRDSCPLTRRMRVQFFVNKFEIMQNIFDGIFVVVADAVHLGNDDADD